MPLPTDNETQKDKKSDIELGRYHHIHHRIIRQYVKFPLILKYSHILTIIYCYYLYLYGEKTLTNFNMIIHIPWSMIGCWLYYICTSHTSMFHIHIEDSILLFVMVSIWIILLIFMEEEYYKLNSHQN